MGAQIYQALPSLDPVSIARRLASVLAIDSTLQRQSDGKRWIIEDKPGRMLTKTSLRCLDQGPSMLVLDCGGIWR